MVFLLCPYYYYYYYYYRTKELNNGRLAMLSLLGIVLQELKNGHPIAEDLPF